MDTISSLILPLIYCLFTGCAWASAFKRRFDDSLAPSLFLQTILVMLSGIFFHRLVWGIYIGVCVSLLFILKRIIESGKNRTRTEDVREEVPTVADANNVNNVIWGGGILLFVLLYLFIFVINVGKRFYTYDEYTHWGIFLKVCLQWDKLYCEVSSEISMSHPDYVPAVTLFEYIWCKLCGEFKEANAYRAIQTLMISMLLPVFRPFTVAADCKITKHKSNTLSAESGKRKIKFTVRSLKLGAAFILTIGGVLLIPLIFVTENGFMFYHSIYVDYYLGIMAFFCCVAALQEKGADLYRLLDLSVVLSMLILTKSIGTLFWCLIIGYIFVLDCVRNKKIVRKNIGVLIGAAIVSFSLWGLYNWFVSLYVSSESHQSFAGLLRYICSILTNQSKVTYQADFTKIYVAALRNQNILIRGAYVPVLAGIVILFILIAFLQQNKDRRSEILLMDLWVAVSGILYALVMYILYLTAMSESEARTLAQYERYLATFLVVAIYLLIYCAVHAFVPGSSGKAVQELNQKTLYVGIRLEQAGRSACFIMLVLFVGYMFLFQRYLFEQALPGTLMQDDAFVAYAEEPANILVDETDPDDRILVVSSTVPAICLHYYAFPRSVGSIQPAALLEKSSDECKDLFDSYNYLFILDDESLDFVIQMLDEAEIISYDVGTLIFLDSAN